MLCPKLGDADFGTVTAELVNNSSKSSVGLLNFQHNISCSLFLHSFGLVNSCFPPSSSSNYEFVLVQH